MEISEYKTIKYEKDKDGGFVLITLNRPEALNAQNVQMKKELQLALHEILKDDDVKVYIFTGAPRADGRPCFCAGMDLKEMAQDIEYNFPELKGELYDEQDEMFDRNTYAADLWARRPTLPRNPTWWNHVWCPKVSIAAVDGIATAGGIELAVVCDIVLAAETAQFMDTHVKNLGIGIGGGSITTNLVYKIGYSRAMQLTIIGEPIDGKKAYDWGLANEVYPSDQLLPAAKEMARKIAAMRPDGVHMTKLSCRSALELGYNDAYYFSERLLKQSAHPTKDIGDKGVVGWVKGTVGTHAGRSQKS
jgi:enoyl-CoA hydratase/carnithine racemase